MPLSSIQRDILRLLAANRYPESYVAGATPLNRDGPRYSADIDIFHDREESVALAAEGDVSVLTGAGFVVRWLRREPGIYGVVVERGGESMRLEMAARQRFPLLPDGSRRRLRLRPACRRYRGQQGAWRLRAAMDEADAFVHAMPSGKEGLLFLQDGRVVQPDPTQLAACTEHPGQRHGHWPSSPEIASAMLERYR